MDGSNDLGMSDKKSDFVLRNHGQNYGNNQKFMSLKSILNEQFDACYDQSAWFVSALDAVKEISAEEAIWKPDADVHSVFEIITHINYWNERWLRRFKGEEVGSSDMEIAETFEAGEKAWEAAFEKFKAIMSEWKALLENADDAKFSELVSAKIPDEWASPIAHMNIHNAYHLGQIILVRKLHGSWDSSLGVS